MKRERVMWILRNEEKIHTMTKEEIIKQMKIYGLYHPAYSAKKIKLDDLITKSMLLKYNAEK